MLASLAVLRTGLKAYKKSELPMTWMQNPGYQTFLFCQPFPKCTGAEEALKILMSPGLLPALAGLLQPA